MIRLAVFDVDGTLYSHKTHSVPQSAVEAVKKLREQGIQIAIASGRPAFVMQNVIEAGIEFDYGDVSFLFTGDCRKNPFKDIIKAGFDVDVDVVKAAHHGAYNATDETVFEAMSPEYMLISCGLDNSYGHPHKEVIQMLTESETDFYRTDYNGTITVVSDGKALTVTAEKGIKNGK